MFAQTKNHNINERKFKTFNEREFLDAIENINVDNVLCSEYKTLILIMYYAQTTKHYD